MPSVARKYPRLSRLFTIPFLNRYPCLISFLCFAGVSLPVTVILIRLFTFCSLSPTIPIFMIASVFLHADVPVHPCHRFFVDSLLLSLFSLPSLYIASLKACVFTSPRGVRIRGPEMGTEMGTEMVSDGQ
jgi:hypothetical protein